MRHFGNIKSIKNKYYFKKMKGKKNNGKNDNRTVKKSTL